MPHTKTCPTCGNAFTSNDRRSKYCCKECFIQSLTTLTPIECSYCGKIFRPPSSREKFCSTECVAQDLSRRFRKRVTLICQHCGQSYEQKPSLAQTSKYCSRECQGAAKSKSGRVTLACKVCGKEFDRLVSRAGDCCSYECQGVANRTRFTRNCEVCGQPFEVMPKDSNSARYCSIECKQEAWIGQVRPYIGKRGPTQPEKDVQNALDQLKLDYVAQVPIGRYLVDFLLLDKQIVIEVDGDYWHSLPESQKRDAQKDKYLSRSGYTVVRITETETKQSEMLPGLIAERIKPNGL